uniref:transposase n=1 Tax=Agathobacter sp. TaxID=2021311 RepID=UPI004057BFB2
MELLYTCLANLVRQIACNGQTNLPEGLGDYEDPNNRNRVVYYDRFTPQNEKIQKIIRDAVALLPKCKDAYEQTKDDDNGSRIPKTKEDGMSTDILQNPSDPDATCRSKAGKSYKGYSANIVEAVHEKGSVTVDYQYDVNTRSDDSFIKEYIENSEISEETVTLIADGAYAGEEGSKLATDKNISVLTTGLLGRRPKEILGKFESDETSYKVTGCPAGNNPKSGSYIKQTDSIRISFHKHWCEGCPYQSECNPDIKSRTASLLIPLKSRRRILESAESMDAETRTLIGRIRNGAETVMSVIRNKYMADKMPVRGKLKTKQFFGFKIATPKYQ